LFKEDFVAYPVAARLRHDARGIGHSVSLGKYGPLNRRGGSR